MEAISETNIAYLLNTFDNMLRIRPPAQLSESYVSDHLEPKTREAINHAIYTICENIRSETNA